MILSYNIHRGLFFLRGVQYYEENKLAREAEFGFYDGRWATGSPFSAYQLVDYADPGALDRLLWIEDKVRESFQTDADINIPAPEGLIYKNFQKAGVWYASQLECSLNADPMGLGKTIQALGKLNFLRLKKSLIYCPASLRYNWRKEYEKWAVGLAPVQVIKRGGQNINPDSTIIMSYELATKYKEQLYELSYDCIICDEAQYLKNVEAQRTKTILGFKNDPGIVSIATHQQYLSGTPIKNRANDFFYLLKRVNPRIIDYRSYEDFLDRWCQYWKNSKNEEVITGTKNEQDLGTRLRANLMVRRRKEDVLPELPAKQYNLVVLPATGKGIQSVLRKETPFSAEEIYEKGVPVGCALPKIRHEMGLAMVSQTIGFLSMLIEGGANKWLLFGYHRDVLAEVSARLEEKKIKHVLVRGGNSDKQKEKAVDSFQNDPEVKGYVANMQAGGVGHNLTEASAVILMEPSWVFSDNDQCVDRAHRMGQTKHVQVYCLVVEGSIGALVLGRSLEKREDAEKITN